MENNEASFSKLTLNNSSNIYGCGTSIIPGRLVVFFFSFHDSSVRKSKINVFSFLKFHLNWLFSPIYHTHFQLNCFKFHLKLKISHPFLNTPRLPDPTSDLLLPELCPLFSHFTHTKVTSVWDVPGHTCVITQMNGRPQNLNQLWN